MSVLRTLWNDEAGFIVSAELVLIATILVIGLIVGMVSLRNQIVQELVDVGQAIGSLSQSYAFAGTWGSTCGNIGWTDGSWYTDYKDLCQATQIPGQPPGGILLTMFPAGAYGTSPPGGEL